MSSDLAYHDDDIVLQVHRLRESNNTCIWPFVMLWFKGQIYLLIGHNKSTRIIKLSSWVMSRNQSNTIYKLLFYCSCSDFFKYNSG